MAADRVLATLVWILIRLYRKRNMPLTCDPTRLRDSLHPINAARRRHGHFSTLYADLRRYPEKFVSFCRLPIPAFDRLLSILRGDITYRNTFLRNGISAEERLLVTLRFLATGASFASLQRQFRVRKSTVSRIVRCTCAVIWQKLQPISMPSPTEETWLRVAAGFQDVANFPNCVGAVDGKYIRVIRPPHSSSKYFSIVLKAVVDSQAKFVAIEVGAYGSAGESRVLPTSEVGMQILQEGKMLPAPRPLSGSKPPVPYVMVSNEAFPLMPNLLRPYPHRVLDARRRIFNCRLSRARRVVECAFSIMVRQWRVLNTAMQVELSTADDVVKACCVLHNYLQDYRQDSVETFMPAFNTLIHWGPGRNSPTEVRVREHFADFFMSTEGAVPWQYSCVGDVKTEPI